MRMSLLHPSIYYELATLLTFLSLSSFLSFFSLFSLSLYFSLSHSLSFSISIYLSISLSLSLSLFLSLYLSLFLSLYFYLSLSLFPINAEDVLLYLYIIKVFKKQMLQAASIDLFNPLVPKAHNSVSPNLLFPNKLSH